MKTCVKREKIISTFNFSITKEIKKKKKKAKEW